MKLIGLIQEFIYRKMNLIFLSNISRSDLEKLKSVESIKTGVALGHRVYHNIYDIFKLRKISLQSQDVSIFCNRKEMRTIMDILAPNTWVE